MDAKAKAAGLREYAKRQGELSRRFAAGDGVQFYTTEVRRGETVKVAAHRDHLTEAEAKRQCREAAKHARDERARANKEARALDQ